MNRSFQKLEVAGEFYSIHLFGLFAHMGSSQEGAALNTITSSVAHVK